MPLEFIHRICTMSNGHCPYYVHTMDKSIIYQQFDVITSDNLHKKSFITFSRHHHLNLKLKLINAFSLLAIK